MAPSKNRRPGFSRKAQYSIFATYVLAISGAIIGALLLLISIFDPQGFSALRIAGAEATAPISRFFNSVRRTVSDSSDNMSSYWDAASKNGAMNKKVKELEQELITLKTVKLENERLEAITKISSEDEFKPVTTGRLISTTASSGRRLAVLSVPSSAKIETGQPVRSNDGLIGRLTETGLTTARVLLVTDTSNVVPVMRLSDGLVAFATGQGDGTLLVRPLNLGVNPFAIGDILVTSGNGGLYPPNIPVARIISKKGDGGQAVPLADPANTDHAIVAEIYEPEARKELIDLEEETEKIAEGIAP